MSNTHLQSMMKNLINCLVPAGILALSGCVVAPARGYYYGGPRVAVMAPAPVVVVRTYARW